MTTFPRAILLAAAVTAVAAWAEASDIATQTLQIQGISLEVESVAVTTGVDIPTSVQTKFGGKKNEEAPVVEGLLAVGDLTGPGLDAPIQLITAPGHRFQIPGFAQKGVYHLQNIRLMKGGDFVLPATPSVATITVADLLQTEVRVRQLTPDELRARGIVLDGRNFDVYEYSFSFLIDGQRVEIPFPVAIDPRTHEVTPIRTESPFNLPAAGANKPPRWTPPDIIPFEFPPEPEAAEEQEQSEPRESSRAIVRPRIPAAIVIPNSLAVLHQFFGVILTVSNGAPDGSAARLEDITATIKVPSSLRTVKSQPAVAFGQPVPIVDAANGVMFLVAQAKGEAEWTLEGLAPGTHTVDIDVRATYVEEGQRPIRLHGTPRASIVVHDARFNINFSHPDTVRQGLDYSTYAFVTNTSAAQQTIRLSNGIPSCDQNAGANVCRLSGADSDEITLAAGETRMIEYRLRSSLTGRVFATAGTIGSDAIAAAVQLHMGVSETGVPLSPATLILPHYAQFLPPAFVSSQLHLLGLAYSVATAPVTTTTAKFPRVIRTDVFYRAVDIARAGQKIFIADGAPATTFDALAGLSLDLLGNGVELAEWDQLRREVPGGRVAGAATAAALSAAGTAGRSSIADIADAFARATAHRKAFVVAIAHGAAAAHPRPYALALRSLSGSLADVPNEAESGWKRALPFADISRFDVPAFGRAGEIGMAGRWVGDLDIIVTPAASGPMSIEVILPQTADGGLLLAHFDLTGTAGESLRIPISIGATTLHAIAPNGATAAVATALPVPLPPRRVIAARQDLHLDPEGHKVSVLFNQPIALAEGANVLQLFHPTIAFDRDNVTVHAPRPIFAAAPQDGRDIVNLSFDHVLTTNASYSIGLDPQLSSDIPSVVPKIDNERPAGILYGRFLKGDNTPITDAEVRLYTGHFRGCEVGLFGDDPPLDCNPYRESPQYARTDASGAFLFEYVPRDPIADPDLSGGYRLLGVDADGRFTIINGAVRLPGSVHFVNLQLPGRGAAEGTVRYDNGEKVSEAEVYVGSSMFNVGRRTVADVNGFFRIDDLPVGPITFSAKDAAGNIAFASGEIATPGHVARKDIVVYRQPFPGTGSVSGVVVRSDDSRAVPGARVGIFAQGYAVAETFTDAEGRYEFRKVPAGFVTVLAADWSIAVTSASYDFDLARDVSRELPPLVLTVREVSTDVAAVEGVVIREDPIHPGDPTFYRNVPGAIVKLGDRPPVITDAQGRFRLEGIPVQWGSHVSIQAYDPETKRVAKVTLPALTAAGPNHVSLFLPANSYGEGLLRIRVLDAQGNPVSGFRVVRPGADPFPSVGEGIHEYRSAPVGQDIPLYAVNGPAAYGEQFAHGTGRLAFPGQIGTVTLRLPGDGTVRVKIRSDLDLIGEVAIRYTAWDEGEQSPAPKVRSASTEVSGTAGWATFPDVPALQPHIVESLHPVHGYATASGTLAYDGDLVDHVLQLNRLSIVRGTVYAIDGVTPVAGASVRIEDGRRDPGAQVTAADGTFAFHDVPAAVPFRVIAETTQSGIYRTGVAFGSTPQVGGPADPVAVLLRRRGSVEGRVVYKDYKVFDPDNAANNVVDDTPGTLADNAPVPLASFWLRELEFPAREFGNNQSPLTADATGRFIVPNVFVGPLRASAWDAANQELQGTWTGELSEEGETLTGAYIAVGNGGTGSVLITVVDPNQLLPVANAEVSLFAGGLFDLATTDGTGVARFEQVPAGTYSSSAYSKALGKLGASAAFVVQRDQPTEIRILLEFSGRVTGTLKDPESVPSHNPVPGAVVTLTGSNHGARTSSDVTGAFVFDGVREGQFALDAKDTESNRRAHATRTLSAADPHPHVDLLLEATETLHVAVYLPDDSGGSSGVLAPAVEVTAVQRGGDYIRTIQANPAQLPHMFRDEPYAVTVRELGGGQRTFVARDQSFPAGSESSPLTFVYGALGTVEVRVAQAGGPASGARVIIAGGGREVMLFTDPNGRAIAHQMPLGSVSVQAISIDGALSGSASGALLRSSVPLVLDVDLGSYAGVSGLVEAEEGGPSVGTRVVGSFDNGALEINTDGDGRYTLQGIRTQAGTPTNVSLVYVGPDGVTVGAQQIVALMADHASQIVTVPTVRLDATPPQLLDIHPQDGATAVAPDTFIRFTFSESIRADQVNNANLQLVAADGSGQVICSFDPPAIQPDGRVVITMRPPPGTPFPLRSNALYRIIVSGQIADLTGHPLPAPRGQTFITSDYAEPRVVKLVPAATVPATRSQTFEFHFSEPIDTTPWQPGGTAVFRFFKIAAAGGAIVAERPGRAFIDPANPARLLFGPDEEIEPASFYRAVFSGVRDLQGNALPEQTFEFFSFDETPPFVVFVPPVGDGTSLVSGVEYTLGVDVRNGAADGPAATDVAAVEWLRVDGTTETFLRTITAAPFGWRFVAPEATAEDETYTLRAIAVDNSGNRSQPATIAFTVKANAAPQNVAVALSPATAYPGNAVTAGVTFEDEGIAVTVQVTLRAARTSGTEYVESKTKQVSRTAVTAPWAAADLQFTLPVDLATDVPATFTATVTDVRGLSATASASMTLTADTGSPVVMSLIPTSETRFSLNEQYRAEAVVSDAETALAHVDFVIDGQTHRVLASSSSPGPAAGTRHFASPLITVTAKNTDTRVSIVATAADYHANSGTRAVEVIYTGVNDPAVPKAAWVAPVDRAALPAGEAALMTALRVRATDDIAVTGVRFVVPGLAEPVAASRVGTSDVFEASVALTTPAAGDPLVITAEISDADPAHTIHLPITIDLVDVDLVVDSTQAVTAATLAQYTGKSVVVRSAAGRLVTHVPVTLKNLLLLEGGRVESLATTTSAEHRVDVTVADHLYIDSDSLIDVRGKGYLGGWGVNDDGSNTRNESAKGRTSGNTTSEGADEAGASHGGLAQVIDGGLVNPVYGSIREPVALGSGGAGAPACCAAGGSGGGAAAVRAADASDALGRFAIAGRILANGAAGARGGSGGSILVEAKQVIVGAGAVLSANGGDAAAAGGGGRVSLTASERLDLETPLEQLQARGGKATTVNAGLAAAPGTVFLRRPAQGHGELLIAAYGVAETNTPLTRATPLSGSLLFDRVELGRFALARFDDSVTIGVMTDERSAAIVDPTAALVLVADHPIAAMTTSPASGSSLIRATDLAVTLNASSIAGLARAQLSLAGAPLQNEVMAGYPSAVTDRVSKIAVAFDAPLGATTLGVRVTDRADRFVDLEPATFTVVENAAPLIDAFTTMPDALYPGSSVTATIDARDDVRVTNLQLSSQIGTAAPIVQSVMPDTATVSHTTTVAIPITTPGGTSMSIEAAVEDGFPSRPATKQTKAITILTDVAPPSLAISEPASGASFQESSGATFTVRASAADAEVGVKTVTAKAGGGLPVAMTLSGGAYVASVPIPNVDGVDPVPVTVTVAASDYEGNTATATVQIEVVPLNDPSAPALTWMCGGSGAMLPASSPARLRVKAVGGKTPDGLTNGVATVDFFIGSDGVPLRATSIGGDLYEAMWNVPDAPDSTPVEIRAVATSQSGATSDLTTGVTIVKSSIAAITADLTIDASNAATFAHQTVIIQSGTVTVVGEQTFARLIVAGGNVTHPAGGALQLTITDEAYVACGGTIDVTGRGYAPGTSYLGATTPLGHAGGSHIGRGGSDGGSGPGTSYGSVYRPREAGGGSYPSNGASGGGVVRVTAGTLVVDGSIRANGGAGNWNSGAGGSVWITAGWMGGAGIIEASGVAGHRHGGGGAIAVEYEQDATLPIVRAEGGSGTGTGVHYGGAGSVYVRGPGSTWGDLIIDNGGKFGQPTDLPALGRGIAQSGTTGNTLVTDRSTEIPSYFEGHWMEITRGGTLLGTWRIATISSRTVTLDGATDLQPGDEWQGVYRFDSLRVVNGEKYMSEDPIRIGVNGVVELVGPTVAGRYLELHHPMVATSVTIRGNVAAPSITAETLTIESGGNLSPPRTNPAALTLDVSGTLTISSTGTIDASGLGYAPGTSYQGATTPLGHAGGSHIGRGGSDGGSGPGTSYGSVYRPREAGGGSYPSNGASGGGVVRVTAGSLVVDGSIRANGGAGNWNSGAGGSVWITAGRMGGAGLIEASGVAGHRHGGGGAIAIEYEQDATLPIVRAEGGSGTGTGVHYGGAGSVYMRGPGSTWGDLIIDNGGKFGQPTDLPALGRGIAQSGTNGNVLVTDRSADIPPYFEGHWVEITRGGTLLGTWRIAEISSRTVTLDDPTNLQPGDEWQGVYRFDSLRVVNGEKYLSADPIRIGVNGVAELVGPTVAGRYMELHHPMVATSVTIRGNVAVPSIAAETLTIESGGNLSPPRTNPAALTLDVSGTLTISSTGTIDASGLGYAPGTSYQGATTPLGHAGGSHIGRGGSDGGSGPGTSYGSVYRPREAGGGSYPSNGASGGGVVRVTAGTLVVDGSIRANGGAGNWNSGAGGSVWITAGRMGGAGMIDASGVAGHRHGGGGAIAIEYQQDATLPIVRAEGGSGTGTGVNYGGAGSVYVRRPGSTWGDLTIDNGGKFGQPTDLPALGRGIAQSGTNGNTLVTDRGAEVPPYFEGHWVEVTRGGTPLGTWRIAAISGRTVTLDGATSLQPGDEWQGVYRLDSLTLRSTHLRTEDGLRVTTAPDLGAGSTIAGDNAGPPVINVAVIRIEQLPTGVSLVGDAGAVTDTDAPVTAIARNTSGGVYTTSVAANGSFSVQLFGAAGESITLSARDANYFPLESAAVFVGNLPATSTAATQINRSSWTSDSGFRAQTAVAEGTLLAVASTNVNGSSSDKLVVLDTTSASAPTHLRTIPMGTGAIRDLAVADGWAYIAADRLATVDLTQTQSPVNPASPDPSGSEQAVAVTGGYAFTSHATVASLHVYDISDPSTPRFLRAQTVHGAESVITDVIPLGTDHLVLLLDNSGGADVRIIDRRNVHNLVQVGSLTIASFDARRGSILGSRLYAVAPGSTEVVVVELSDPAEPSLAGRLVLPTGGAGHVRIAADLAFVANTSGGLTAVTLDPAGFVVAGNAVTTGNAQDVAVTDGVAYVANESGIAIVPVTIAPVVDPSRISLSRSGTSVTAAGASRSVTGIAPLTGTLRNVTSGDTAALTLSDAGSITATVAAAGGDALEITVSDSIHTATTRSLGSAPFVAPEIDVRAVIAADNAFFARRLAVDGDTTLLTGGTLLGSRVSSSPSAFLFRQPNASEPAQIVVAAAAGDEVNDSAARSGFGYFVGSRFSTINYLNSTPTTNTAASDPAGRQYAVALMGNYAFVAGDVSSNGSVHVYDVSTPTTPVFVRTQAMSPDASMIYRALIPFGAGRVIAISPDAGRDVTIIDVSDPNSLARVAVLDVPFFTAYRGTLSGNTLYLAGADGGVALVELADAASPQHVSTIDTPGIAFAVAAIDSGEIVVADGSRGITFIDTTIREQPVILGSQPLRGQAVDVKVVDGLIHVATEARYYVLRR